MTKYMLIRVEDARWLTHAVDGCAGPGPSDNRDLVERLSSDEGGDFEAIVAQLKGAEPCAACSIEGQLAYCANLEMHKIGRRLDRLVERAQPGGRGHRLPTAEEDAPAPQPTEEPRPSRPVPRGRETRALLRATPREKRET